MVDIYRNDCNKEEIIEHALPNYKGESPSPCTRAVSTAGMKSGINLALPMLCAWAFALGAYAQERLDFVTVTLDEETREADEKLMRYLEEEVGLEFSRREYEYGTVINRLADWDLEDNGEFLARTTPYVYVASEMLGAEFEILATYRSVTTKNTTYQSYFVVNRDDFPEKPKLDEIVAHIEARSRTSDGPVRFRFHNKFSTSSYFLPSFFFRDRNVFHMERRSGTLLPIRCEKSGESSSDLVRMVAGKECDLAAVWDGTKSKFDGSADPGQRVHFVELPTLIPNDLLVCSATLAAEKRQKILDAIGQMEDDFISTGDFLTWVKIGKAREARNALSRLRWLATGRRTDVTVSIDNSTEAPVPREQLEAAEQAARLSGSELVLHDNYFHERRDYKWTLERIHDGAIILTSSIEESELPKQKFHISFEDAQDLTKRIGNLIHSRMHRIRYLWPYKKDHPTVIRDVDYAVDRGAEIEVQTITWRDPQRNDFAIGNIYEAKVVEADFHKFELEFSGWDKVSIDPMSNVSYRVILARSSPQQGIFVFLTVVFVALLGVAVVGLAIDLLRKARRRSTLTPLDRELFKTTYREMAANYHRPWREHRIADANVYHCDRHWMEKYITELKSAGVNVGFDIKVKWTDEKEWLVRIPVVKNFVNWVRKRSRTEVRTVDFAEVGNTVRLESLIGFLEDQQKFSYFMGTVKEWDVLNEIAHRIISQQVDGLDDDVDGVGHMLQPDHGMIARIVSQHFHEVLEDAELRVSFFQRTWTVNTDESVLICKEKLPSEICLKSDEEPIREVVLELPIPEGAKLPAAKKIPGWLLGRIEKRRPVSADGTLVLQFKAMAILKDFESHA